MLKLFKFLSGKQLLAALFSVCLIISQVQLDLMVPDFNRELIEMAGKAVPILDMLAVGGKMLACAFGSFLLAICVGFFAARIATGFGARLRHEVFYKTMDFSLEEIGKFSTPSLITRTTNDITQVQMLIAVGMQVLIKAPILSTMAIIKMSSRSWQWMASTAGAVGVLLILISVLIFVALPKFKKMQTLLDNLNRQTRENLTGLRVIRSFNASKFQEGKFESANKELTDTNIFTGRVMAIMNPGMGLIMSGITLSIYWLGAYIINATASPIGVSADVAAQIIEQRNALLRDTMTFTPYAMQVIFSFVMLTMVFIMMPRSVVAGKRVKEVLDTPLSIKDGKKSGEVSNKNGVVEFKNVCFKYPNAEDYVLKDISFSINKGETIAFIGSTGSGKSTLVNLIPRFYDATDGQILVDGINIKDIPLKDLRDKIGYVSQKAVLFSGSIKDNIAYGAKDGERLTDKDVKTAAQIAQAEEFILELEEKYDANVSQGGTNLSGGQKQRLAIARAVAKNPEVYIFDDSFSALDYKTDKNLRSALKEQLKDATCLIVGQRIGTIKDADKIMVLDEGEVVGLGTHSELLRDCKVYQEIAYSQLSKEELER